MILVDQLLKVGILEQPKQLISDDFDLRVHSFPKSPMFLVEVLRSLLQVVGE